MICRSLAIALAGFAFLAGTTLAGQATGLKIAPIIVEIPRGAATTISIENVDRQPVDIQIRAFRWSQRDGKDHLEPTRDFVASPPQARIAAGSRNIIRLVRLSKSPVAGEESYRILIDEIPRREKSGRPNVGFAVRYSVPVFFGGAKPSANPIRWSYVQRNGQTFLTATNSGPRRVRISELTVLNASNAPVSFGKGLVGYVLGNSTITWPARSKVPSLPTSPNLTVLATTEHGKIKGEAIRKAAQ